MQGHGISFADAECFAALRLYRSPQIAALTAAIAAARQAAPGAAAPTGAPAAVPGAAAAPGTQPQLALLGLRHAVQVFSRNCINRTQASCGVEESEVLLQQSEST